MMMSRIGYLGSVCENEAPVNDQHSGRTQVKSLYEL